MTSRNIDNAALIPEYLNGLLDREEVEQFEAALRMDIDLKNQFDEYEELQKLYREAAVQPPAEPPEAIFNRIMEEINTSEENSANNCQQTDNVFSLSAGINAALHWLKESVQLPWALAVVQTAVILLLLIPRGPDTSYKTLSQTTEDNGQSSVAFNIVFNESAREADIRQLLLPIDGSIISGPSQQGRYQISVPGTTDATKILTLLKQSDLIVFVEKSF